MLISERTIKDTYKQARQLATKINAERLMLQTAEDWNNYLADNWQPAHDRLVFHTEGGAYQFGLAGGPKFPLNFEGIKAFSKEYQTSDNYPTFMLGELLEQLQEVERWGDNNLLINGVPEIGLDSYLPE